MEDRETTLRQYDPADIEDAPEMFEYGRALGILTWGTWEGDYRPVDQRIRELELAFPPEDPVRRLHGLLEKQADGSYGRGHAEVRLERFLGDDWRPGSIHELLSRYGLRMKNGPPFEAREFDPRPQLEVTRQRNQILRALHGGVDVEATDMDEAKSEYLDKRAKRDAAVEIRAARKRMQDDIQGE